MIKWKTENKYPSILIMTGEGKKAFCAGGDVVNIYKSIKNN